MRISSTMMVNGYLKQLNTSYENQTKLMEQSDGSKLHRPSDDAVGYSKYLRYQNSLTENTQYQSNVSNAISWMKNSDATLVDVCNCLKTVVEKTNAAANGTNNESDMKAIAQEMLAMVQQAVSDANIQVDGHYLMSGQKDLVQPFSMSEDKKDCGIAKTMDDNQKTFFYSQAADGNKCDRTGDLAQMLTLRGSKDGGKTYETYYLNTTNGKVYTEEFMTKGYKAVMAAGRDYVQNGDEVFTLGVAEGFDATTFVKDNFKNTGELYDDAGKGKNWSPEVTIDGETVKFSFDSIKQYIVTYNGDEKYISMVKQNGAIQPSSDTVNVTGHDVFGSNIFDDAASGNARSATAALNDLLAVVAKTEEGDNNWLSQNGMTLSNNSYNTVLGAETKLAARQQVYTAVQDMLTTQNVTITGDISSVADTDVAELAVKLMSAQLIYNMSLSVGGKILPGSLADYL